MAIKSIDAEQLKKKMDNNEKLILVDCREQHEWDEARIEGAIFIPLSRFQEEYNQLDKNAQIIMQCRSGRRSLDACYFLAEQGYQDLTNLEGGILGWDELGYPIIR